MYAKFNKCEFWITEVRFFKHLVSALGVSVDPEKVELVMSWERLKSFSRYVVSWGWLDIIGGLLRTSPD